MNGIIGVVACRRQGKDSLPPEATFQSCANSYDYSDALKSLSEAL